MTERQVPNDPVLRFMLSPEVFKLVVEVGNAGPWSRLSATRMGWIGYRLIVLRCAQIGIDPPTRQEAMEWWKPN